jgi:hypothetical protein
MARRVAILIFDEVEAFDYSGLFAVAQSRIARRALVCPSASPSRRNCAITSGVKNGNAALV